MATVRELVTKWGFRVDDRPLRRVDARVRNLKTSLSGLTGLVTNLRTNLALLGVGAGVGALLKQAGDFEQVTIAFETLTQSQEKAAKLQRDLVDFAVKTPFQLKGVFDSTKQLLAYGIESENMIDTLTALGNVAAGVGKEKLPQLTLAFGQVRAANRLRGQEVRQFTEAGVPINEIIAKEFGIASTEVQDFVSRGEVDFDRFNKAFQDLANGTGRFTGLMEKQSRSFLGIWSNLQDLIQVTAAEIGKDLLPEAKAYLNTVIAWGTANKKLIKEKILTFIRALQDGMKRVLAVARILVRVMQAAIEIVGGFENAIKLATIAMAGFVGIKILRFMGDLGLLTLSATKNFGMFVAKARLASLAMFSLKGIALAIPLAIGAAVAALFLIIEDLVVFFKGGDSLIGELVNNFDEAAPKFMKSLESFEKLAVGKVKSVMEKIVSFLTGEEFAGDRTKIADALLAALDVALVGSVFLAKIGFQIGQAIFDGIVEVFADKAPALAGMLGLESKKSRGAKLGATKRLSDVASARDAIEKFGLADASQVYSPETIQKAQAFRARLNPNAKAAVGNKEAFDVLKNNSGFAKALQGGISTQELMKFAGPLTQFNKAIGNTGEGNKFNTTITIDGNTNLTPETITQAVNEAQMKTVRDLANETQSAISE